MTDNKYNSVPLNKNNKVPKLRFKTYSGCYTKYNFAFLYDIFNGLNKDKESFGFGYPIVNYMDVNKNIFITKEMVSGLVNTTKAEQIRFNISTRDILITRTSETKQEIAYASCILESIDNCVYSGFLLKASPKYDDKTFAPYITLLLHNPNYRIKLMRLATETSRALINSENLSKIEVFIPNLDEQKKIYYLFNLLEKKINILDRKINILKKYKKGLMQKTFETNKKLPLGSVLKEINVKTTQNNQHEILSSTATGLFSQKEYFNHQVASENNIGYKIIKRGELLFSPQNLWLGNINLNMSFDIGIVSPSYKIYSIDNRVNKMWLIEKLKAPKMLYNYKIVSEQGASVVRRNLDIKQFMDIIISIPVAQNSIGNVLELLQNKINALSTSLNCLKKLKMHLLQSMFI